MLFVFDCGNGGPHYTWGPWLCDTGLGGSEESVIFQAEALARRGHTVNVYCRCGEKQSIRGVNYFPTGESFPDAIDVYISWRHWELAANAPIQARLVWLWCFDIPVPPHFPDSTEGKKLLFSKCNTVVLLNEHHRNRYRAVPEEHAWVCPIGIVKEQFLLEHLPQRIPGRVIYASHPHRGLHELRRMWPKIKQDVPWATLASYWWQPEFFLPEDNALGILPMRSCGYDELAYEMLSSDVLGYPSVFHPEIAPAICIKSQAAGAVPVVVLAGGMVDVTKFGFFTDMEHYVEVMVRALRNPGLLEEIRPTMQAWAISEFDWDLAAKRWEEKAKA